MKLNGMFAEVIREISGTNDELYQKIIKEEVRTSLYNEESNLYVRWKCTGLHWDIDAMVQQEIDSISFGWGPVQQEIDSINIGESLGRFIEGKAEDLFLPDYYLELSGTGINKGPGGEGVSTKDPKFSALLDYILEYTVRGYTIDEMYDELQFYRVCQKFNKKQNAWVPHKRSTFKSWVRSFLGDVNERHDRYIRPAMEQITNDYGSDFMVRVYDSYISSLYGMKNKDLYQKVLSIENYDIEATREMVLEQMFYGTFGDLEKFITRDGDMSSNFIGDRDMPSRFIRDLVSDVRELVLSKLGGDSILKRSETLKEYKKSIGLDDVSLYMLAIKVLGYKLMGLSNSEISKVFGFYGVTHLDDQTEVFIINEIIMKEIWGFSFSSDLEFRKKDVKNREIASRVRLNIRDLLNYDYRPNDMKYIDDRTLKEITPNTLINRFTYQTINKLANHLFKETRMPWTSFADMNEWSDY